MMSDHIDNPDYYCRDGIELSKVIEAYELPWHLGNVVKYVVRAGKKKPGSLLKDLRKAKRYLELEIEKLEKTNGNGTKRSDQARWSCGGAD